MGKKSGKGKGGKGKKNAPRPTSLLTRLFRKEGAAQKAANGKAAPKAKAKPLTPLDRSIQEIKHMASVGESDPERLAMMLSRLLSQEKEKERQAKEDFDRMVWDIVRNNEAADEDGAAPDDAGDAGEPPPRAG